MTVKLLFENWRGFIKEQQQPQASALNDYSYVFGTIDGAIIEKKNENRLYYGASMNKPMLAFVNLVLCQAQIDAVKSGEIEIPSRECLNHRELTGLLNYGCPEGSHDIKNPNAPKCWGRLGRKGNISNKLSRLISGKSPAREKEAVDRLEATPDRIKKLQVTAKEIRQVYEDLGLEGISKVRHATSDNKQSAAGVFHFLKFLSDPHVPYPEARAKILKYMGTPFKGHDSAWWRAIKRRYCNR